MKKVLHKADSRGHADYGWLNTYYSFSFSGYYNPERIHFGMLRVLNDDTVAGGMGFGMHPHDNMEIITIPVTGTVSHKDNMGNSGIITKGEVQIMSAGKGILHSEYNASAEEELKLFQIWVFPKERNIEPRYEQKKFSLEERKNKFQTVVAPDKQQGALWINQDAFFSLGDFENGKSIEYNLKSKGNGAYIFMIEGSAEAEGEQLERRDAIGVSGTDKISLKTKSDTSILVIEVPMQ